MLSSDASSTLVTKAPNLEPLDFDDDLPTRTQVDACQPADPDEAERMQLDFDEEVETRVVLKPPSEDELARVRSTVPPPPTSGPQPIPAMAAPAVPDVKSDPPPGTAEADASEDSEILLALEAIEVIEPEDDEADDEEAATGTVPQHSAGTGVLPPLAPPPRRTPPPQPSSQPDTDPRPFQFPDEVRFGGFDIHDSITRDERRPPRPADSELATLPRTPRALESERGATRRVPSANDSEPNTARRPQTLEWAPGVQRATMPVLIPPPRPSRPTMPSAPARPSQLPLPPARAPLPFTPSAALMPRREVPRAAPPPRRSQPLFSMPELARPLPAPTPPPSRERANDTARLPLQRDPRMPSRTAELPRVAGPPRALAGPTASSGPSAQLVRPPPPVPALPSVQLSLPAPPRFPTAPPMAAPLPAPPNGALLPVPAMPLASMVPPPVVMSDTVEPSGWSKVAALLGALSIVITMGLGAFLLWPRTGSLRVELEGGATGVGKVEIFVDGQKRCDTAPCVVNDLPQGVRHVQVAMGDAPPVAATETVAAGRQTVVVVPLHASSTATIKAAGSQPGVKVFVDGQDHGPLPAQLRDLPPGQHKLTFDGGERYEKVEQTMDLTAGQVLDLGDIVLPVRKGLVTVHLDTPGATVVLVSRDRRAPKLLPGPWPMTLDVQASEGWRLTASKSGHRDQVEDLGFGDGKVERTIHVQLARNDAPVAAPAPRPAPLRGEAPAAPKAASEPATQEVAPPSGTGTLNANSLPVSKVMVDGRAVGSTPVTGISLPAGSHTVTFVHPELGKKSVTVTVRSGERAVAAVRFTAKE